MTSHSITSRIIASDVIFTCNSCSRLMPAHVKCPRTEDHRPDAEFRAKDPERKRWKIDLEKPELGRFLFKDCPKCASIRQTAKRRKEKESKDLERAAAHAAAVAAAEAAAAGAAGVGGSQPTQESASRVMTRASVAAGSS